jgi:hypothetical protein
MVQPGIWKRYYQARFAALPPVNLKCVANTNTFASPSDKAALLPRSVGMASEDFEGLDEITAKMVVINLTSFG